MQDAKIFEPAGFYVPHTGDKKQLANVIFHWNKGLWQFLLDNPSIPFPAVRQKENGES
jgi:hypothetical protein